MTKQKNYEWEGHKYDERARDGTSSRRRNFGREMNFRERCGRLRFCLRRRIVRTRPGRGGGLPGSPSPRGLSDGPVAARVGAPSPRLRCTPRGHTTLPGTKVMPVLPLIFDTIPE